MNTHKLLTYALNSDNRLMYINDVPNGLECNCICPGCKEKLMGKFENTILLMQVIRNVYLAIKQ